jgi:hypothetical protein
MDELFDELKKVFEKYEIQVKKKTEQDEYLKNFPDRGQYVMCTHSYYELLKETGRL